MLLLGYKGLLFPPVAPSPAPHLSLEAAQGLHKESGPAHMQHRRGAALLPLADAIIEPKQVGEALRVLEGRSLALGALDRVKKERALVRPLYPSTQGIVLTTKVCTGQEHSQCLPPFSKPVLSQDRWGEPSVNSTLRMLDVKEMGLLPIYLRAEVKPHKPCL